MKTIKFLTIIAAFCSLMSLSSCGKPGPEKPATEFSVEVTNIRAILAMVDISLNAEAELVRFLSPMPKADFDAEVNSADAAAVKSYISQNGEPVALPFKKVLQNLTNGTEYIIGVVAYNANMDIIAYKTVTFTTLETDDRVVGDASSAGSLTENTL